MFKASILKRVVIPAAAVVAESSLSQEGQNKKKECVCRPSELPLYTPECPPQGSVRCEQEDQPPQALQNIFATARQGIMKVTCEIDAYTRVGTEYIQESKKNADWLLGYLREEDNVAPKAGAIAIGGLTGFILGLRGGFIRRTLYTGVGALGMASVCYPKEAAEYSEVGLSEAKKYIKIAYNFAYGVKKDDPPLELPSLPKLPTSLSEAWDTVSKSARSLVSDKEEDDKPAGDAQDKAAAK